ncbi:MAG: hypothetical protein M1840_003896 [Geoglossum simile]|nr:MAG: hypothetical protein M1840_003896 [Geoglossum simile]
MAGQTCYTEYLQSPDLFDSEYHVSWNSPDMDPRIDYTQTIPWSSRLSSEDGKFPCGTGILSSSSIRLYPDTVMDALSPYPMPMNGPAQSPSSCSDDLTELCPSTNSDYSPRASLADLQLEYQYNNQGFRPCLTPPRDYPIRQSNCLLESDWTRTANIPEAQMNGIVCLKEVQIQTYADEEAGDMAFDEPDQMGYQPDYAYDQDTSDTIVVAPRESSCSAFANNGGRVVSANADSPTAEEDDNDSVCSTHSNNSGRARQNKKPSVSPKRLGRNDPKFPKAGKITKQRKGEWRCSQHLKLTFKTQSEYRKHIHTQHTRPFLCTFYFAECDQHFGSKNEWKRHVHSQHLQLGYWQCDYPTCAERSNCNIFNRKDLFTQHLRRMHLPKQGPNDRSTAESQLLPEIWKRCYKDRRGAPNKSTCGYCGKEFRGDGSWDDRMEHVGHHYEDSQKPVNPNDWKEDKDLVSWMLKEGLIRHKDENMTAGEQGGPPKPAYTVFGTGNKISRRRSDDEFSDTDRKRFSHRAHPPRRAAIAEADTISDVDAEADEDDRRYDL